MNYTIVGLFPSQENAKEVSEGLEKSGIRNQDYIIYRTDRKNTSEQRQNFWKKLFGQENPETVTPETDKLITSVAVHNEEELSTVKKTFEKNDVVKIYEFQDMTIDEAKDLNYIKKIVALRAKSHIYAMPEIKVFNSEIREGINTEVKV